VATRDALVHNKDGGILCHWQENVVFDSTFLAVDNATLSWFEFALADVHGTTNIDITFLMGCEAVYPSCKAYIVLRTKEAWQRLAVLMADDKKRKEKVDNYAEGFLKTKRQLTEADVVLLSGKMPYDEDSSADHGRASLSVWRHVQAFTRHVREPPAGAQTNQQEGST
jgi:hypothetical protein